MAVVDSIRFPVFRNKKLLILLAIFLGMARETFPRENAAPAQISAGISRKSITPAPEVINRVTQKPYGKILDSLFVRALVLKDNRRTVAIIALDLLEAGESATSEIRKLISEKMAIPVENILINVSHTHSALWSPLFENEWAAVMKRDAWWHISQDQNPYYRAWKNQFPFIPTTMV